MDTSAAFEGGAYGISSTEVMLLDILNRMNAWRRVLFEMYEQSLSVYGIQLHLNNEDLIYRYRRMPQYAKTVFKQGVKQLYSLIQTTTRSPYESSFDLRTMTLRRKEKFYEDMEFLVFHGLRLV